MNATVQTQICGEGLTAATFGVSSSMLVSLTAVMQEEQRTEADLADLAESAQLHHQLRILGGALQTAQLDPAQFGLNATVSACATPVVQADEC